MPEIENSTRPQVAAPPTTGAVRETRFDPPHKLPRDVESAVPSPGVPHGPATQETSCAESIPVTGMSPELVQQFRLQAQQLATHLDTRQRDLDRREAELHARIA